MSNNEQRITTYPIALNLQGKSCVVVGGGALAAQKVEGLLRAGAQITVISPSMTPELVRLVGAGRHEESDSPESGAVRAVRWRAYRASDLDSAYLAYGASEDRALNARVARDARERGVLVNAVDDIPNCDFFAVSIVRRGDLQVAISTNGRSPAFARWMREYLEEQLPAEFGDLLDVLGEVRAILRDTAQIPEYERWREAIDPAILDRLRAGDREGARSELLWRLSGPAAPAAERGSGIKVPAPAEKPDGYAGLAGAAS